MVHGALLPLRISIVLHLLLLTDLVSVIIAQEFDLGDTVTINCEEGCNKSVTEGNITLILWQKINSSHILRFITTLKENRIISNFSEPRSSFQDPTTLRITDAQPSDSGNYTCQLTTSTGFCDNTFAVIVSEISLKARRAHSTLVYASSSAAGAIIIIIIIIIGIVYCRTRQNTEKPLDKIHQTSPETQQREEPIYDNADQNYCLRFNTLYDGLPVGGTMQSNV